MNLEDNIENIQGGVLKPHGRPYAGYFFLRMKLNEVSTAREWLKDFTKKYVTSHTQQLEDSEEWNGSYSVDQKPLISIAITSQGLLDTFGVQKEFIPENIFNLRMSGGGIREELNDYDVEVEPPFHVDGVELQLSAVIIIAGCDEEFIRNQVGKIKKDKRFDTIIKKCCLQFGFRGENTEVENFSVGPLGFADGLSNKRDQQELFTKIFVEEELPGTKKSYGTFMALRKLEVDRAAFEEMRYRIIEKAKSVGNNDFSVNFAEGLLMGRLKGGTPLALSKKVLPISQWRNDKQDVKFSYMDIKQNSCPVHAHARIMNPRINELNTSFILRRSMLFGDVNVIFKSRDYTKSKGMFFVSYQRNIINDFIPLFKRMAGEKIDKLKVRINVDPIAYILREEISANNDYSLSVNPEEKEVLVDLPNPSISTFKGGDFFYVPSIVYLNWIASLN